MQPPTAAPFTADALAAQLGVRYARFTAAERARHLTLLARVQSATDVALEVQPSGAAPDGWTLTWCTADRLGALSLIAGLLTAGRFDIQSADIFSVRVPASAAATAAARRRRGPAPEAAVRRTLDIFEVRALAPVTPATWDALRADAAGLLGLVATGEADVARAQVIDRVAEVLRAGGATGDERLWPVQVEVADDTSTDTTALQVRGQDAAGFLFELANALALLDVNIVGAEVRTVAGESRDVFWVSDARGEPIRDASTLRQLRAAAALIKQFTVLLPHAPDPGQALRQFSALTRRLMTTPDWAEALPDLASSEVQRTLAELMGASAFLWEDFLRMQHANLFPLVGDSRALDTPATIEALRAGLDAALAAAGSTEARRAALNTFKDREMFRIDLRHITDRIDFRTFAHELTALAETVVGAAARLATAELASTFGTPRLADGSECAWSICALGKFGGRELGFASDIELLFTYEGDGTTDGPHPDSNARYFEAFVRTCTELIAARREGIFEVDLRLRPFGNAGPLASSEAGLAAYYHHGGEARQFERLALVKLRPVAGDPACGARVEAIRDAFVYASEPLDRTDIRHLRARQAAELVPAGSHNAKYSAGGVVDIEYWVQARQIEAGADDPRVRATSTLDALAQLSDAGYVEPALAAQLSEAYAFLRRLIDALRVVRGNAKDLAIPDPASREFAYLARRLDLEPLALASAIETQMATARATWDG